MALIPGFENDIFISYAHVDNKSAFQGQVRWIEQFCSSLNVLLDQRFPPVNPIQIWWDKERLKGNTVFDAAISKAVSNSAIIICLNSPGYRGSDYCKKEIELFHKKASAEDVGLTIDDRSRIFNVLLDDVDYSHWAPQLSKTTGFNFHDGSFPVETDKHEFRDQMKELVKTLEPLIVKFQEKRPPKVITKRQEDESDRDAFTIFLGDVPDTLRSPRKRIIADLGKSGYKVLADIPPPYEAEAHEQKTKELLQNSDLAIHLLDKYPGREIKGVPDTYYPQKQTEISLKISTPKMIWIPSETDFSEIEEEDYKFFLQDLETKKSENSDYEFIRSSKSDLSHLIVDSAKQLQQKRVTPDIEKDDLSVLLDLHGKDLMFASELINTLQKYSIHTLLNPQTGEPEKNLDQLEDRISRVKKLIFLYGDVTMDWLLERISIAQKVIINGGYNIQELIVYMSPPLTPFKTKDEIRKKLPLVNLNIIDGSNDQGIDGSIIKSFRTKSK